MWPDNLIKDIAAQRVVLFFGAGASMNSVDAHGNRPKSWIGFLNHAISSHASDLRGKKAELKRLMAKNDLLTACEVIRRSIGRDPFVALIKDEFQNPGYQPAEIHDLLWKLNLRINITPNFDNIYDTLVSSRASGTVTIKNYFDDDIADCLRRSERVFIKSHGSVSHPDKLIFTRTDYAKARSSHSNFYELLDALLRTHTFLFIGCGLDDPDIRLLLENYCYKHPHALKHYFVMRKTTYTEFTKNVFEDSLKLKILEYKNTKDHSDLMAELKILVDKVELARQDMASKQSW